MISEMVNISVPAMSPVMLGETAVLRYPQFVFVSSAGL